MCFGLRLQPLPSNRPFGSLASCSAASPIDRSQYVTGECELGLFASSSATHSSSP